MERLSAEFDAVGFYISGHPLDEYMKPLSAVNVESYTDFRLQGQEQGRQGRQAGRNRDVSPRAQIAQRQPLCLCRFF